MVEKRRKPRVDTMFHKGARLAATEPTYEAALQRVNFPLSPAEKRRFHRGFAQGKIALRIQDFHDVINALRIDQLEALRPEFDELYERYAKMAGFVDEDEASVEEE